MKGFLRLSSRTFSLDDILSCPAREMTLNTFKPLFRSMEAFQALSPQGVSLALSPQGVSLALSTQVVSLALFSFI